jgi:hypothetical protein
MKMATGILMLAIVWLHAGAVSGQCPEGMVGYWKLDETTGTTAYDSMGLNTGTLVDGPAWDSSGKVGGALAFDGVNDYVNIPDSPSVSSTNAVSVVFWAYRTSGGGASQYLVTKDAKGPPLDRSWQIGFGRDNGDFNFNVYDPSGVEAALTVPGGIALLDTWMHFACVFDNLGTQKVYRDGVEIGSNSHALASIKDSAIGVRLAAGYWTPTYAYYLKGALDEVAIFDRALTAEEIGELHVAGLRNRDYCATNLFAGWQKQMKIQFAGYAMSEALENIPMLVVFSTNIGGFSYADFLSSTNADLRFVDATWKQELNYEIESWNTNGDSHVWVQVPRLVDANTHIHAIWGKSGETAPACTTNGATWSNGYLGVWHLANGSTLTATDSSSYGWNGTVNAATAAAGVIGGAANFNGSANVAIGNLGRLPPRGSIQYWMYPSVVENYRNPMTTKYNGGGAGCFRWEENTLGAFYAGAGDDAGNTDGIGYYSSGMASGTWHSIGYAWDTISNNHMTYLNGLFARIRPNTYWPTNIPDLRFGTGFSTDAARQWKGLIDEVRISSVIRSTNWLWAEYVNAVSNASFIANGEVGPVDLVSISGRITNPADGEGVEGVVLRYADGGGDVATAGGGYYAIHVAAGWSGTITAETDEGLWAFDPPERVYADVATDLADQDFAFSPNAGSNWLYRMKLTLDSAKVDEDLTNFPVLVKLTGETFDFTKAREDGFDFRFLTADGCALLAHERERHDAATQQAEYWVRLPFVSSSEDTEFHLYFGKADAPDAADPAAVWSGGFAGVWHMVDETALSIEDSTANQNAGIKIGTNQPQAVAGHIAEAQDYGEADYIQIAPAGSLNVGNAMSASAWIQPGITNRKTIYSHGGNAAGGFQLEINGQGAGSLGTIVPGEFAAYTGAGLFNTGTWNHVAYVRAGNGLGNHALYLNGVPQALGIDAGPNYTDQVTPTLIGARGTNTQRFAGILDEIRISSVVRPAAWIQAEVHSGNDALVSKGTVEFLGSGVISGRVTDEGSGVGVDGVLLQFSNDGGSATTAGGGWYTNAMPAGWSGTVTPQGGSGISFIPESRSYTNLTESISDADFQMAESGFPPVVGIATGAAVADVEGYRIHTFTNSGTFEVLSGGRVEVLVIAGGGGGGKAEPNPSGDGAGGGGAGGVVYTSAYFVSSGVVDVVVGSGGSGSTATASRGANGGNSVFHALIAIGGGGGGSDNDDATGINMGADGGSGGGAANRHSIDVAASSGTSGQGNSGAGAIGNTGIWRGGSGGGGSRRAGFRIFHYWNFYNLCGRRRRRRVCNNGWNRWNRRRGSGWKFRGSRNVGNGQPRGRGRGRRLQRWQRRLWRCRHRDRPVSDSDTWNRHP